MNLRAIKFHLEDIRPCNIC